MDDGAAHAVRAPEDLGRLAHIPAGEALARPGGGPAPPAGGQELGDDLDLDAVGGADGAQGVGVAGVVPAEAHVVPDDDRPRAEEPLEPVAHEALGRLVCEGQGVGDDERGVEPSGGQGGQAVRQGGDHRQVDAGAVDGQGVRVEGDGDGEAVGAQRAGPLDDAGEDPLVAAVDAVEDTDGHDASRAGGAPRGAQ